MTTNSSEPADLNTPAAWSSRIAKTKRARRLLATGIWADSVLFRKGQPFGSVMDEDRVNVNQDWSKTKSKHSNLFSQIPRVNLLPKHPAFAPAVPVFSKLLNDTLTKEKVGVAMDEAVIDCINASGIGIVVVGYERLTEPQEVPERDLSQLHPDVAKQLIATKQVKMVTVQKTTSKRFPITRISPSDFLWPVEFTGSDFDQAPWIGRTGSLTWVEAVHEFGLTDDIKSRVVNGGKPLGETINQDPQRVEDAGMVEFDEIYFWNYKYDPNEKYFDAIHRLVFITGIDKPVVDEPWKGQQFDPQTGTYIGACEFPIRVLTLTYISDDAIPPSDSEIGRPQVLELIKSRSQMVMQRERSLPLRWHNVNFIDPVIEDAIMHGTWQGSIPVNGDGNRVIGEVARASYPRENMEFDRIAKMDLDEAWQTSANQVGSTNSGQRSASEVNIVQQNFQTRVGYERARVGSFFVGISRVLAGYLSLYGDFTVVGQDQLQIMDAAWDRKKISQGYVYDIFPDSTVLLDSNQHIQRLMGIVNMLGKSGLLDLEPIVTKIITLSGEDPTTMLKQPTPPPTAPIGISIKLADTDLTNPIALAFLMKSGQAPNPQELAAAVELLKAAQGAQQGLNAPPPLIPGGLPPPGGMPPPGNSQAAPPNVGPTPQPYPNDAGVMEKINKRGDFGG